MYQSIFLAAVLAMNPSVGVAREPKKTGDINSPHAAALQLVFELKKIEIRNLDTGDWWTDSDQRAWSAVRAFPPGVFDSTHLFFVTYKRNNRPLKTWFVDTRIGTIEDAKEHTTPKPPR